MARGADVSRLFAGTLASFQGIVPSQATELLGFGNHPQPARREHNRTLLVPTGVHTGDAGLIVHRRTIAAATRLL